ncbi:MAG: alpha-amylase [Lachnospiraceae bacterium]|nr:alpha-amylase [Lachnospiraceae bacterium]
MKRVNTKGLVSRTSAWILSAALAFSSCPVSVHAEESLEENGQVAEEQQIEAVEEQEYLSASEAKSEVEVTVEKTEVEEESEQKEEESSEVKATKANGSEEEADSEEVNTEKVSTEEISEVVETTSEKESEEEAATEVESVTEEEAVTEVESVTEEECITIEDNQISLFAEIGNVTKTCPTIGADGKVTFHYYSTEGEEVTSAYVKGSWKSDWSEYFYMTEEEAGVWSVTAELSLEDSYEYGIVVNDNWVGDPTNPRSDGNSQILRNPSFNNDGSVTIFYYPQGDEDVKLLYKLSDETEYTSVDMTKDAYHSALLSATVTAQGDYSYMFEIDGVKTADVNCKEAVFSISKLPEEDASVKSPVIDGNVVTFHYFAPTAKSVTVAGEMNGWDAAATPLTYNGETGFWSIDKELIPGKYEYKFVVDGNWTIDSRNDAQSNGNSVCYVSGLKGETLDVEAGSEVILPTALKLFDANGVATDVAPTYTIEEQYQSVLKVEDGKIAVPKNFTTEYFKVIASYESYTADVYVNVKANVFTYTLYYLDEKHQDTSAASLWVWSNGVNGVQYYFDAKVELSDGNTWLKAEIKVPYEVLYIIPRAYADWSWQDADKEFANSTQEKNVTLYLVNGDTTAYTEIPDLKAKEYRYVMIEYNRPANDYEGWNIYSWNTGYGSEVTVDFKEIAGKMVAFVPVVDTKESISFCMRRSEEGNPWAEKDGGDHMISIPLDQKVVKATFEQGTGVTGNRPYNIGYVTDVTKGEIHFYYRDDALYQKYEEASLQGKVKLVLDGTEYDMAYDAQNERYFYTGKLEAGSHYYGYMVDSSLILDRFNAQTGVLNDVTYSVYEYIAFDAELSATVEPSAIDYNQNAVLSLSIGNEDNTLEIVEAYADLSALGQSSQFVIDPALMEATIAVNQNVTAGEKEIPVTVKDQYGNLYETTVKVTVLSRGNNGDFDWDEAVIYFAVTDRFFDGNSSNNDAYRTGSYNPSQGSMYHGGDFAGLEAKLDYLQDLGVNTIWITPIVENIEDSFACDGYDNQYNSGYHGYWASDFTKLNQHLGTEEEFSALINAMHARGMKIMVDVVLNHSGYGVEDVFNNTYIAGKNMLRDNTTTIKGDDKKDALSGLPDFVTEDREVSELLVEWQTAWVEKYDIDYFRVDTVKHVDDTTWKAFKNELTKANPEFKMIGEYAGSGYATHAGQLGTGQMDSILDFDFNDKALDFVGGNLSGVENFMEGRNAGINNSATVGSFLGSHDEDGLMYRMVNERGFSENKAYDLMKVAATFQITAKGQPVIYYGEELGQTGANNWPYQENRYDMDWASANDDNEMLVHYKKLLDIRNEYTDVFAKGTRNTVKLDESNGVLVVSRNYAGQALYVGFNINQAEEKEITVPLNAGTTYTDLYSGDTYKADNAGMVNITIPAATDGGTVILKAGKATTEEKPQKPSDSENNSSKNHLEEDNIPIAPAKVVLQPIYTRIDGKIVSGWKNVIEEAVKEAETNRVPLGEGVNSVANALVIDIVLAENTVKTIPADVVKSMVASNSDFRFHYGNDIVLAFTSSALAEVTGDLDLNILVSTDKDFGQNFKSIVLDPRKESIYGAKLAVAFNLGKENAGKTAFVFHRNLANNQVELMTTCLIAENGTIAMPGVDYTDLIILY